MKDTIRGPYKPRALVNRPNIARRAAVVAAMIVAFDITGVFGCISRRHEEPKKRIEPIYDQSTGRLQQLQYDSDGDGRIDSWCYMDGSRVIRIEVDENEDGKIDRWEHYDAAGRLEKTGFSRNDDGVEDAWSFANPDGSIARIEIAAKHDEKVTRIERYEGGAIVSAEEDTDGDGRFDRWETYQGERLISVAFDTRHRGSPDRRLVYDANHGARVEVDEHGDGRFVAVSSTAGHPPNASK